jgi:molecular chaperone GrpE
MTADDPKVFDPDVGPTDGRNANDEGESLEQTIERLTAQLREKTEEAARNRDLYLRERAETENFKKRMQREKADGLRFAVEPLARDLLPVIDNLERAVEHAGLGGNGQPLVEGVRLVLRAALEALERHGVTRLDARSGPFDPSRHEAVMQVPDARRPPNQIVEQFEPGYSLHDRLLRPAKVSVSTKPRVEGEQNDD